MINATAINAPQLQSKKHFEVLDGLRGVAAIGVVIYHFMEIAIPDYKQNFIAHAHLAVDFFFCLSGFVIAYAYDQRLEKIGIGRFFLLRLIRLHPLVIIGSLIGILLFMFDPFSNLFNRYSDRGWIMFITSCLMIPYPLVKERYFNLFHLNPPTWSLFWEYVANIAYALILVKLNRSILIFCTILAVIALFYEAHISGHLSVGWGGDNFSGGGIRVACSFLLGILAYRSHWRINWRPGFLLLSVLLFASFLIPFSEQTNAFVDPFVVVFCFPLLIIAGAGAEVQSKIRSVCKISGEISYPLYMVHYPFIWLFMSWVEAKKPNLAEMTPVIITGVLLLILFAYGILKWIDMPLRRFFTRKLVSNK